MTGGIYTPAWWRECFGRVTDREVMERVEKVLADVRKHMTADEVREARTIIEAQWERLGGRPADRRTG